MNSDQRLEIGKIGKPHGLRGDLTIRLTTNRYERMEIGAEIYLGTSEKFVITGSKPYKNNFLVSLSGVGNRNEAENLSGEKIFAEPLEDPEIKWAHELIGCIVIDNEGKQRGPIVEIQANPASDLMVLGDETLVPFNFLTKFDGERVYVDTPKGIFEDSQS